MHIMSFVLGEQTIHSLLGYTDYLFATDLLIIYVLPTQPAYNFVRYRLQDQTTNCCSKRGGAPMEYI